jgi:thiamine pyrophosphokinase
MRVIIALKLAENIPELSCDYIGADKGALTLSRQNIHMVASIGDFDSIEEDAVKEIESKSNKIIRLNPIKDDSDSEAALNYAIEQGYDDIQMYGAFGGRMDHSYYNIRLAFMHPNLLTLYDDWNKVYALKEGLYKIKKDDYPYISFFTDSKAIISLNGFEYELNHREIDPTTIYTLSNSILNEEGTLNVEKGVVLVLQTKDR